MQVLDQEGELLMKASSQLARSSVLAAVCVAGLVVAVVASSSANRAQREQRLNAKIERKLIGTWRLTSYVIRSADGKTVLYPYGRDAVGKLTYTGSRDMWALVARRHGPKSGPNVIWYTGTFRVDGKAGTVIHRVQYASVPAWENGDQVRRLKLAGHRLTLSLPAGKQIIALTWRKVNRHRRPTRPRRAIAATRL